MPVSRSSPYRVLGIAPSAGADEIRRAYAKAIRERRHSREEVTAAFNRLRDPARRLALDLREPDIESLLAELSDRISGDASGPLVDEASAPLPAWSSLVDPQAPGWDPPRHDVAPPSAGFRSARLLEPPPAAELPTVEFGF